MKFFQSLFFLAGMSQFAISANATSLSPNLYTCTGKDLTFNYTSSSITGQPTLSVEDKDLNVSFNYADRKEIKSVTTPMGTVVTGTYIRLALADGPTLHYNLIVPASELKFGESLKIETQVVRTSVLSLFRPHGISLQLQHNEIIPVTCEAQAVQF